MSTELSQFPLEKHREVAVLLKAVRESLSEGRRKVRPSTPAGRVIKTASAKVEQLRCNFDDLLHSQVPGREVVKCYYADAPGEIPDEVAAMRLTDIVRHVLALIDEIDAEIVTRFQLQIPADALLEAVNRFGTVLEDY